LTFLLSAPAINPVVLVATAVAFPQTPQMVVGRLVASLLLAVVMGVAWEFLGQPQWLRPPARVHAHGDSRLAGLAVVLAICSEADAFVAASLSGFSLTAKLAFLVVGPVALQAGTFGRRFAARFAPATFVVAIVVSVVVAAVLW
jgi:uncharacterized protein